MKPISPELLAHLNQKPATLPEQLLARAESLQNDAELLALSAGKIDSLVEVNRRLVADNEALKKAVIAFAVEVVEPAFSDATMDELIRDAARYRFVREHCDKITLESQGRAINTPQSVDSFVDSVVRECGK